MSARGAVRSVAAMAQGDWLEGLDGARGALAAGDDALASADRELAGVLGSAYALAAESVRRIEAVAASVGDVTALEYRDQGRILLERHRDIIAIVNAARESVAAKTVELQRIVSDYRAGSR